jgi:hypothetical protein
MAKELAPPHAGWQLEACETRTFGNLRVPRGALIEDISWLGRNALALIKSGVVRWVPPSSAQRPKAHALPPPVEPRRNPPVTLVDSGSPIDDWRDSVAALARQLDNNDHAKATDLLLHNVAGRDLFQRAQYEAGRRKVSL